jgi:hypothetical protein
MQGNLVNMSGQSLALAVRGLVIAAERYRTHTARHQLGVGPAEIVALGYLCTWSRSSQTGWNPCGDPRDIPQLDRSDDCQGVGTELVFHPF